MAKNHVCPNCGNTTDFTADHDEMQLTTQFDVTKKVGVARVRCSDCGEQYLLNMDTMQQVPEPAQV